MLQNLKVATRLFLGFGAVIVMLVALGITCVVQMRTMDAATNNILRASKNQNMAQEILEGVNNMRRYQLSAIVSAGAERIKELDRVTVQGKQIAKLAEELEQLQRNVETKQIVAGMRTLSDKYAQGNERVLKLAKEDDLEAMKALVQGEERVAQRALVAEAEKFIKIQEARKEAADKAAEEAQARAELAVIILTVVGLIAGFAIALWITLTLTRRLGNAVTSVERVASGDLAFKMDSGGKDEIGMLLASLERMRTALAETVYGIRNAAGSVELSSSEIAQGNANLSQRTEEQASSLEETASSMEELTSTVRQNAENAKRANQLTAGASEVAVKGGHVVGQVVSTMNGISESSKKIADIIGVIDGIAFQTNILALNAAVEAARAGEQGRGFAVVASEVRNLAQKSAAAAKEIKSLIGDSVDKVGAGAKLVESAGKTMEEIVTSVKRVTDIMAEIAAASQQQSAGIEQVNTAITQMDSVTQQNASLVEEAAAAAESMEEQARTLIQAVAVFKLGQEAQGYAAAAPVAVKHAAGVAPKAKRAAVPQKRVGAQAGATLESANEAHLPKPKLVANAKAGSATAEWTEH